MYWTFLRDWTIIIAKVVGASSPWRWALRVISCVTSFNLRDCDLSCQKLILPLLCFSQSPSLVSFLSLFAQLNFCFLKCKSLSECCIVIFRPILHIIIDWDYFLFFVWNINLSLSLVVVRYPLRLCFEGIVSIEIWGRVQSWISSINSVTGVFIFRISDILLELVTQNWTLKSFVFLNLW